MLLSSAGLTTSTLVKALQQLVVLPLDQMQLAYITTAAMAEGGDKNWVIDDLKQVQSIGCKSIDLIDIALEPALWRQRLESADILYVGGGQTLYLVHWFRQSGLALDFQKLLESKVYVGVSAGSMILGPVINSALLKALYAEDMSYSDTTGLGVIDFTILPHLHSHYFPQVTEGIVDQYLQTIPGRTYVLDDHTAILIDNDLVEVIGNGQFLTFD